MNPAQLLSHFDRIGEAPDAIPRLRRFILDLAVRGKLVEQDPRDEPASVLLKRIDAEKASLMKKGKIQKQPLIEDLDESDLPFELPQGWLWSRLGNIGDWGSGSTPPRGNSEYYGGDVTWLKSGELGDCLALQGSEEKVTEMALKKCSFRLNQSGDVLIAMYGATIGKLAILAEPAVTNQAVCGCTPFAGILNRYLFIFLLSRRADFHSQSEGGAQPNISKVKIVLSPFALPPLAEQQRIVAKVDELMALCDRLEAAQTERERRRDRLMASSLHHLNNGADADADAFRQHARFYFNHLPRLTTRTDHIKQLRQTILNLAVRGKLVEQDPTDEPASELVQRIGGEKADNEPFSIPISWVWISVGQIGDARLGKMLDKGKNKGTPRRYLRNVNVRWFDFDLSDVFQMRFEDAELAEFALRKGDVLICEGGEPGRAAVWDERENKIYFQKAIHRVRFPEGVAPHFFVNALRQSADSGRLSGYFTGVGIKHFTGRGLSSFVFPLPPLAEQHRIVAKVDELMTLCDQLETQITTTQSESQKLLEAILHGALAKPKGKI
ncbi:MAG: type I restriction endonuclease EcoAI subunit S [Nitrospirales bacterium]|nr:MAG: type I restriction endonuclease EcoAI subunit S [Nitrospirales bacterium]GJL69969.1 MAG: type I restriction endonuclease EcoAI subunit S [Nitrospirales bacterium]